VKPGTQPINLVWWLVSRASGIVALALISLSVLIGLTMAAKVVRRPGLKRAMVKLHEHIALAAILAIGAHGLSLLGDHWLRPGLPGIAVPFALSYKPTFTGLGIIGGYLVVLLGPSFYLRRRIGARRWRRLHGLIIVAWILSAVHTLGAGSDAHRLWLQTMVVAPVLPIVYVFMLRRLRPSRDAGPATVAWGGLSARLSSVARVTALTASAVAILLTAPAEAKGTSWGRVDRASGRGLDRAPYQLDRVMDRQRVAQLPQMGVQLGGTSGIGRRDRLGAGLEEVPGLAGAEL
jgi:sulfoxide reductase heme-binding subunit YedZ